MIKENFKHTYLLKSNQQINFRFLQNQPLMFHKYYWSMKNRLITENLMLQCLFPHFIFGKVIKLNDDAHFVDIRLQTRVNAPETVYELQDFYWLVYGVFWIHAERLTP